MVRVVRRGRFSIYVYAEQGQRHHAAHCHVYWSDGESVVSVNSGRWITGDPLPPEARQLVGYYLVEIKAMWDRLNRQESGR